MTRLLTMIGLCLIGLSARADVICNNCEYTRNIGTYLGGHWPGDRSTFANKNMVADIGAGIGFDNRWVFDVNQNTMATLVVAAKRSMDPRWGMAIEVYSDAGSVCAEPSSGTNLCFSIVYGQVLAFDENLETQRAQVKLALVPGRYIIRVAAQTRTAGDSEYSGKLTLAR